MRTLSLASAVGLCLYLVIVPGGVLAQPALPDTPTVDSTGISAPTSSDTTGVQESHVPDGGEEQLQLGAMFSAQKRWKEAETAYAAALESTSLEIRRRALDSLHVILVKQKTGWPQQLVASFRLQLKSAAEIMLLSLLLFVAVWLLFLLFRLPSIQWKRRQIELAPVTDATKEKYGLHFSAVLTMMLDTFRNLYSRPRFFSPSRGTALPLFVNARQADFAGLVTALSSTPPAKVLAWFAANRQPEYRIELSLQTDATNIEAIFMLYYRDNHLQTWDRVFPIADIRKGERDIAHQLLMTIKKHLESRDAH